MYVDNYVPKVVDACNLNNGYPQGAHCYKISAYQSNRVIFVNSHDYSSRVISHNIANNFHNPISGNSVKSSNLCMANNGQSHYVNQSHQRDLGIDTHGSAQRDFDPYDRNINNRLPSLNSTAISLNKNTPVFIPQVHEPFIRFANADTRQTDYRQSGNRVMGVNGYVRMSPPRVKYSDRNSHKQSKVKMMGCTPRGQPLRKRNRSDTSTDSTESHSSKFFKTSEDAAGVERVNENHSQFRYQKRHQSDKMNSSKNILKNNSYDMKRLLLGPSISKFRYQQELESRLKAMVYSIKILREDKAVVVPSLPSILSLPNP